MKLTIFAATGGTGRQLLTQARAAGHEVTAVARDPTGLPGRVVTADLSNPDPAALKSAVDGADAVLSGLGPRGRSEYGIASRGTNAIISAMRDGRVRRLVVVSVAGISEMATPPVRDPGVGFFTRNVLSPIARARLREHYVDVTRMEGQLRTSGLDWTSVRLPLLTDKPMTGTYRTAVDQSVRGGWRIARADVAHFMLRILTQPATYGHAVTIAY